MGVARSTVEAPACSATSLLRSPLADPAPWAVAAFTMLALGLRISQLHQSLWGDEVFTYHDIVGRSFGTVLTTVHAGGENSPPLFFLMAWATAKLGNPTVWIRLPSMLLGPATIPVVYLVGRETVGRRAGVIAGAIIALSPFSFYYQVEARPYASMAFFVALSTWALLRAVRGTDWRWWALYVVAADAAAYCHYTCIFLLVVQGTWSMWACRGRIRTPVIAAVAAIVLYAPWLPHLRGKELSVIAAFEPLTAHNVITDLMRPIGGYPYAPLSAIPTYPGLAILIACAVAGAACLVLGAVGRLQSRWPRHLWLIVALTVSTPIGMFLYSEIGTDLWIARGLYASVPAAALLLAALVAAIPRPGDACAVVAIAAVLALGAVRAGSAAWRRPPLRSVAAYLDRSVTAREPVAIHSFFGAPAIVAQMDHPIRIVNGIRVWGLVPHGGRAAIITDDLDDTGSDRAQVPAHPAGFRLIAHRAFRSAILATGVWVYRRSGS